jgi:hypothetical protein
MMVQVVCIESDSPIFRVSVATKQGYDVSEKLSEDRAIVAG